MNNTDVILSQKFTVSRVTNGSASLRVFSSGKGESIVCLPGIGRGPGDYCYLGGKFSSEGLNVVLPESRGFKESPGPTAGATMQDLADDVAAAIKSLGGGRVVLLGAYYGGRIARMVATKYPELVRGVAILTAVGKFPPKDGALADVDKFLDRNLPQAERFKAAKRSLYGPIFNRPWEDLEVDNFSEETLKMHREALSGNYLDYWVGGSAPLLIVQGLSDLLSPPENGRALKEEFPKRVKLVELEGVGHAVLVEAPDRVFLEVMKWIKSGFVAS